MTPLILRLDVSGAPIRWIPWEEAACLYSKDMVAWTAGERCFTLHGGVSRRTGERSTLTVNSIIAINPKAREEAAALDRERAASGPRGPLHGIPLVIKDNIDLAGLATTAGSLAFAGLLPADDAFQVKKLREAGAVIIAKSNMHELASGITTISSIGGQTCNPYNPDRSPGGSSGGSGAAVAAASMPAIRIPILRPRYRVVRAQPRHRLDANRRQHKRALHKRRIAG